MSNTFNSVTFNSVFDRTSQDTPQNLGQDLSRLQSSDDKSGTKVSLSYETSMKIGFKPDQDCSFGNINKDNLETMDKQNVLNNFSQTVNKNTVISPANRNNKDQYISFLEEKIDVLQNATMKDYNKITLVVEDSS